MAQSSLITVDKYAYRPFRLLKELVTIFNTTSGHDHDGTNSKTLAATGNTLDQAYDQGGAGSGRAITVDSGAITLTNNAANNNNVLEITKNPVGAQSGAGISVTIGAQATGAGISFANTGSGNDILGTDSLWSVSKAGVGTFDSLSVGQITLVNDTLPAGTSCYIGRDNTGDTTINALTGKTVNLAIAGTDVITVAGASVTIAQALTVSTGGAAITGNSTITGDLTVTGNLTFGGNWTVAATLTVDELILDTDGVAPAATNCYAVRDNAGDLTVNAITAKTFNVAINNTDEFNFSATTLDMNANGLDNTGFVILNAATAPDATEVYAVNDNTGDLTLNALTGKAVNIAVNGVDEVALSATAHVFNEASNDRDFRIESADLAYAVYVDGGKNSLVFGANTDLSDANRLIRVGRLARTATDATSYADLWMEAAGAVTTTGVTAVVATAYLLEPNITVGGGSVTDATVLYVGAAPTEGGTGNYSIMAAGAIGLIADDADMFFGAGRDVLLRWSTADASNHAFAIGLGASLAIHICQAADIATDWNVNADSNPTIYVHGATTPATEYVAISTDETDAHLNAVGANWKFEIGGTAELTLAANALNLVDSILYGSSAAHSADTADGSLYLRSTSNATKGFVCIANAELGLVVGSDGSVDRATTVGTNTISLFNGTAPAGTLANGVTFYSEGGEAKVLDAAGNSTTLSPHTDDGDYVIHSYSAKKDETVTLHVEKLLKALANTPALARFVDVKPGHVKRPVFV